MNLLKKGFVTDEEIERFSGRDSQSRNPSGDGMYPDIPCNPCQDACPKHCIKIGAHITSLPAVEENATCVGCGMCVASCSGQAIFLVDETFEPGFCHSHHSYEFLPCRKKGKKDWDLEETVSRFVR